MFILLCCVTYFALSIERTWPDLHFTTDYILYNWVCDEKNKQTKKPWEGQQFTNFYFFIGLMKYSNLLR